jgi:hypothetical protein
MDPITLGIVGLAAGAAWFIRKNSAAPPPPAPAPNVMFKPHSNATKDKACAAANTYVALLQRYGLPKPPGWDSMNCDQRIAAAATVAGGGALAGMAEAAAAAEILANYQSVAGGVTGAVHDAGKKASDAYKKARKALGGI